MPIIYSMTGFGRSETQSELGRLKIEIRALNNRSLNLIIRVPKTLTILEARLRSFISERLHRGRIEVWVDWEALNDENINVQFNHSLAKSYYDAFRKLKEEFQLAGEVNISLLARIQELFTISTIEIDWEKNWQIIENALEDALKQLNEMRKIEGEALKKDFLKCLDELNEIVIPLEEAQSERLQQASKKLEERIQKLMPSGIAIEPQRIAMEIAILSDKIDFSEECVRLRSHIKQFKTFLDTGGPIGRKLNFLLQEMQRGIVIVKGQRSKVKRSKGIKNWKASIKSIQDF